MRSYIPKTLTKLGTDEGTIFTVVMLSGNMIPQSRAVEDKACSGGSYYRVRADLSDPYFCTPACIPIKRGHGGRLCAGDRLEGVGVMTEEQARTNAKALALGMGITFYVVRSREGRFLPVQLPSDDCEVLASIAPPGSVHDQGLA
jgi:hypothetical protein